LNTAAARGGWGRGGGGTPNSDLSGRLRSKEVSFYACSIREGRENRDRIGVGVAMEAKSKCSEKDWQIFDRNFNAKICDMKVKHGPNKNES